MSCSLQLGERASNVGLQPGLDGKIRLEVEAEAVGTSVAGVAIEILEGRRMCVGSSVGDWLAIVLTVLFGS